MLAMARFGRRRESGADDRPRSPRENPNTTGPPREFCGREGAWLAWASPPLYSRCFCSPCLSLCFQYNGVWTRPLWVRNALKETRTGLLSGAYALPVIPWVKVQHTDRSLCPIRHECDFRHCRHTEAAAAYEACATKAPLDPLTWHNLGVARLESGQHREAVTAFKRAHALAPHLPVTQAALGQVWSLRSRMPTFPSDR
jgi:hypothetical protein